MSVRTDVVPLMVAEMSLDSWGSPGDVLRAYLNPGPEPIIIGRLRAEIDAPSLSRCVLRIGLAGSPDAVSGDISGDLDVSDGPRTLDTDDPSARSEGFRVRGKLDPGDYLTVSIAEGYPTGLRGGVKFWWHPA